MSRDPIAWRPRRSTRQRACPHRRRRRRHVHRRDPPARRTAARRSASCSRRRRTTTRAVVEAVAGLADRPGRRDGVVHGTTVATNAVLERRGARHRARHDRRLPRRARAAPPAHPAHVRPVLAQARRRSCRAAARYEVNERVTADGTVLRPLDRGRGARASRRGSRPTASSRSRSACCTRTASRRTRRQLGEILRAELPGVAVSLSSEILREQREYERSATTVVNAYVRPLMRRYVGRHPQRARRRRRSTAPLTIMQSSGGVMTAEDTGRRPVLALESGPGRGRRRGARRGAAARLRERDLVRHGRHDREGVADRGRRGLARPRVRGRRLAVGGQPPDARRGRAAADPDDRHRRGRRGRRLDRLARRGGRAAGRAAQRGRRRRGPPATGAAARTRRSPTPTSCSG